MKGVLIIPALNEAAVVGDLVRRTPRNTIAEVIVVDNGSRTRRPAWRAMPELG